MFVVDGTWVERTDRYPPACEVGGSHRSLVVVWAFEANIDLSVTLRQPYYVKPLVMKMTSFGCPYEHGAILSGLSEHEVQMPPICVRMVTDDVVQLLRPSMLVR